MVPSTPERPGLTRRSALGLGGAAAAGLLGTSVEGATADDPPPRRGKTVGIQVGSVSFVDEGVETVLDILQERGRVDTVYLTAFTYGRGLAGRQVPGQPFPDHGVRRSDEGSFRGGNYARPHPRFYQSGLRRPRQVPCRFTGAQRPWASTVPVHPAPRAPRPSRSARHAAPGRASGSPPGRAA